VNRLTSCGAVAISALVLVLIVAAAAANVGSPTVIRTNQELIAVAMSGFRVAYDVGRDSVRPVRCGNQIIVWNVRTGTKRRVSGKDTCSANASSTGSGVTYLAIAGNRIAWIINWGGNTEASDYLRMASLPGPKQRLVASATRYGDIETLEGTWIGNLVGSGDLLAVNRWVTNANGAITRSELDAIGKGSLRRVAAGQNVIAAQAVASGRIAVLRSNGSIGIYGAGGNLLRQIKPDSAKEIALQRDRLLVLTKTKTLAIYNSRSGALLRSWPVPEGAGTLATYAGVAAYADYSDTPCCKRYKVHVVRLATGKDVVIANGTSWLSPRDIDLDAGGLIYVKNSHALAFVPLGRLLVAVS
jgi:hypothetical protein